MLDLWGVILAWCSVLDMADFTLFMCSERSSLGGLWVLEKIFENRLLELAGEYSSSNDLRAFEL